MVTICLDCGGKHRHMILKGGLTDGHRRSHVKRGRRLDARNVDEAEAQQLLAAAALRLDKTPAELAAERAAAERAARAAEKAARKAEGAQATTQTATVAVVADPHAGKVQCECGDWVAAEWIENHRRGRPHLDQLRRKRAAERRDAAKMAEIVAAAPDEDVIEAEAARYAALVPESLGEDVVFEAKPLAEAASDGADTEKISADEMEEILAEDAAQAVAAKPKKKSVLATIAKVLFGE